MALRIYIVTFHTEHNRIRSDYVFFTFASNAAQAAVNAKTRWTNEGHKPHQFHIKATRSNVQDPEKLECVTWKSEKKQGRTMLEHFTCTEISNTIKRNW